MSENTNPTPENVIDFHRELSLMLLRSSSGFAVRTPRGQKDPGAIQWDPKTNSREKSTQTIKALEQTNDNVGIHLFGSVVDVDVDTDNPVMTAALDYFLPHTAHVWGRPSRRRTHRLYELGGTNPTFTPQNYAFLSKIQAVDAINVEVRGGEQRSGQYSLLPGSVHPSGEIYQWEDIGQAKSTPVQVGIDRLMEGVRLACVATLIVPYWVEGMRNEMCKALCGFMYRASRYSLELNSDVPFDKEVAQKLLEGIMYLADDDPADYNMRIRTLDQTWEKGDADQPIVGATKITEVTSNPDLLPLLYVLLAHTEQAQVLDALFEKYAMIKNTVQVVDLDDVLGDNYIMNKEAFVQTLAGHSITTQSGRVSVSQVFLNSLQRTVVSGFSIDPNQGKIFLDENGRKVVNLWRGWNIPPHDGHVDDAEVAWFIEYIVRVVSRGDTDLADWIFDWLADIFQNPTQKPGTMLVLVGEQGAGKSALCENILRPIIGDAHMTKASSIDRITSKFNAQMAGKLLIQGEEVLNSNRKSDADAIKDMITSRRRTIELKGKDPYEQDDLARYVLTSNHLDNAVNVGKGDRRTTIVHVSDEFAYMGGANVKKQQAYWGPFFKKIEGPDGKPNRDALGKLHKWFRQREINRTRIRVAYDTEIKRATRNNSSRGIDTWLLSLIELENPFELMRENDRGEGHSFVYDTKLNKFKETTGWPEVVPYAKLELAYKQATSREHGENKSAQQLAKFFKDNGLLTSTDEVKIRYNGARLRARPFPTRKSIGEYLRKAGFEILESKEDDVQDAPEVDDEGPKF